MTDTTDFPPLTDCPDCGGRLRHESGPGRTRVSRGFTYNVPADLVIPVCPDCGARWPTGADLDRLDDACREQRAAHDAQQARLARVG